MLGTLQPPAPLSHRLHPPAAPSHSLGHSLLRAPVPRPAQVEEEDEAQVGQHEQRDGVRVEQVVHHDQHTEQRRQHCVQHQLARRLAENAHDHGDADHQQGYPGNMRVVRLFRLVCVDVADGAQDGSGCQMLCDLQPRHAAGWGKVLHDCGALQRRESVLHVLYGALLQQAVDGIQLRLDSQCCDHVHDVLPKHCNDCHILEQGEREILRPQIHHGCLRCDAPCEGPVDEEQSR
mmetsp:Transcript_29857/g.64340  ORF Transcript_29857/g.64340 Transcript_29857/m.64340 type:complete len:234 (+) Transcript_29857:1232-1933(+)